MINLNNGSRSKTPPQLDPSRDKVGVEGGNTTPVNVEIVGNPNLAREDGALQDIKVQLSDVATDTTLLAVLAALAGTITVNEPNAARETTLQNLLRATQNIASTVWTDDSGAFYIQRQNTDPTTGQTTFTYTDGQGNPATPGSGLKPASAGAMSLSEFASYWVAIAAGTDYAIGDSIAQLNVYNISTSPPTQVLTAWININTGVTLTNAPPAAHIEPRANNITVSNDILNIEAPNGLPLPFNAAKETGGNLEQIKAAALDLAKETTAQATQQTAQEMLDVLGTISDPAYGGSGGATIDAILKGLYARLAAIEGRMPVGPALENGNLLALAVGVGAKGDAVWAGTGDGTLNALLKAIYANSKPSPVVIECSTITSNNVNPTSGTKIRVATFENTGTAAAIIRPVSGSGTGSYSLGAGKTIEFRAGWNDVYLGFTVDANGTTVNAIIERVT